MDSTPVLVDETDGQPEAKRAYPRRVGIMIDSESLGLDPNSIVRELAFVAFDLDDPDTILAEAHDSLPLQPQEELGRTVSLPTVAWLMTQPEDMRRSIDRNLEGDVDEFLSICRHLLRRFSEMTRRADYYETWFARPQHDVPMIQSLLKTAGMSLPWKYDSVNDLRTLMNEAGMDPRSLAVKELAGDLQLHTARGDCLYQIRCYAEAVSRLRAR